MDYFLEKNKKTDCLTSLTVHSLFHTTCNDNFALVFFKFIKKF